jgi:hypothetical protein
LHAGFDRNNLEDDPLAPIAGFDFELRPADSAQIIGEFGCDLPNRWRIRLFDDNDRQQSPTVVREQQVVAAGASG